MSGSAIIPRRPAERARSESTSRGGRLRRPVRGLARGAASGLPARAVPGSLRSGGSWVH